MREIGRQGVLKADRPFRGAFRLVRRSARCGVGQLNDRGGDPAPAATASGAIRETPRLL